ncbi:MAG: DUF2339 domain-containing protein [Xanthobacteraceae bacterium]
MDGLIALVVLLLLAAPVIGIVALIKTITDRNLLRQLDARVKALEGAPVAPRAATPATAEPAPAPIVVAPAEPTPSPAPPTPPPTSVPLSSPLPIRSSTPQKIGIEERFGTRWVVWVGGVALALGGIFLVRYTIQQGLIGPGVRIFLGALLALALVAAGEWSRRTENLSALSGVPSAHIPGTLTAAGTTVAYATVYAAYGLYGFLPPAAAFILLGAVALLTLGAALLHGPALAGLGVIGAYLAPMLVASAKPDYWSLYVYIAVVNAAAFALARFRMWRWLAIAAIVLGALWTLPGMQPDTVTALGAHVFHALAGFALVATFLVCGLLYGPPAVPGVIDRLSTLALVVYLLAATLLVLASRHDPVALIAFVVLTAATVAIAWRTEAAAGAVPAAAILATLVMAHWAVHMNVQGLLAPSGPAAPAIPEPERYDYGSHLILAAGWAVLFGAGGFLAQGRSPRALVPMLWSATAVFAPLAMLVALYYRIAQLDRSLPFAALALLVAAIFAFATETLVKRAPRPGVMAASAMFATGTLGALALALTFALEKGWLTIALALMVPGIAWVAEQRSLPWLRWLAAIMVAVVVARVGYEPRIVGADLGTTPIFNWLLYGYGVPAAAFWVAGWLLRRRADDLPARMVDAGAILFTVLLAVLEIRHYVTGGDIYRGSDGVVETMLYVNVGLAMTIGLERVRERTGSIVHNAGALLIAALTLVAVVAVLLAAWGAYFNGIPVGGAFFNLILLGYGLPAVLAIMLALIARTTRPIAYRIAATAAAVTLALFYLTLEVKRLFHGPVLAGPIGDAEQYTYSTVWLAFGIALLAVGFFLRSQPARLTALAVIALTIAKVFIIDTASISGIYRALSVIGLGVVLLGIGWVYQHVLYPRARTEEAS